jgi:uncharacterized protein (TIGR03435 family)
LLLNDFVRRESPHPFLLDVGRQVALIGIAVSLTVTPLVAQAGNTPRATATLDGDLTVRPDLAFDVVSIHPSNTGPERDQLQVRVVGDEYQASQMPLGNTILMAYFPFRVGSTDRIVGAPDWVWKDDYDFVGKVGEANLPVWQKFSQHGIRMQNPMLQTMLQNALAECCKLVVHRVPTQVDGYALVLAKDGPNRKKLIESKPADTIPDQAIQFADEGRLVRTHSPDNPVWTFYQTSMSALALYFTAPGASVEDKTGLTGKYRFDLIRLNTDGNLPSTFDLASLGLKLIPAKIPVENIVVDHIERPLPN